MPFGQVNPTGIRAVRALAESYLQRKLRDQQAAQARAAQASSQRVLAELQARLAPRREQVTAYSPERPEMAPGGTFVGPTPMVQGGQELFAQGPPAEQEVPPSKEEMYEAYNVARQGLSALPQEFQEPGMAAIDQDLKMRKELGLIQEPPRNIEEMFTRGQLTPEQYMKVTGKAKETTPRTFEEAYLAGKIDEPTYRRMVGYKEKKEKPEEPVTKQGVKVTEYRKRIGDMEAEKKAMEKTIRAAYPGLNLDALVSGDPATQQAELQKIRVVDKPGGQIPVVNRSTGLQEMREEKEESHYPPEVIKWLGKVAEIEALMAAHEGEGSFKTAAQFVAEKKRTK